MIVNSKLGLIAVSGEFSGMRWGTAMRTGAMCGESRQVGVLGGALRSLIQTQAGGGQGVEYAHFARTADHSRLESQFAAAGTPRPKGVVGECPRGIPA
ncbi:hypothetical protein ACFPZ0_23225 [Streptomonospora nanhaiensis]|uniref:Uncharacterized protein n=1 Tax=Streptomonospora nanhaiensis TaxID=1323731 RepID=A0A853BSI4_9ACTN|nr:hypothetical protein [Streptomonospora nanhaiensis]MBV2362721.1 hypothetical protein [Streptomonospora nanhaiensis]MBX9390982.1 hypothetical protein [Streptomonospora nanhaiensis]NYI97930.1 hypothetical protein [Streptomonospora nanhaiensis]